MSQQVFRLIDEEDDRREANGEESWANLEDCLADIKQEVEDTREAEYLPWRVVLYDRNKSYKNMFVRARITGVDIGVRLFGTGVGGDHDD